MCLFFASSRLEILIPYKYTWPIFMKHEMSPVVESNIDRFYISITLFTVVLCEFFLLFLTDVLNVLRVVMRPKFYLHKEVPYA